ncbi:MAG TPA: hypothetical protein VK171_11955 [Fimbriimonas sp.]|nr:hypothetical protein [Fimbriimonas sp.]
MISSKSGKYVGALCLLLVLLVGVAIMRAGRSGNGGGELNEARKVAIRQGVPLSVSDLDFLFPAPSARDNAGPGYVTLGEALPGFTIEEALSACDNLTFYNDSKTKGDVGKLFEQISPFRSKFAALMPAAKCQLPGEWRLDREAHLKLSRAAELGGILLLLEASLGAKDNFKLRESAAFAALHVARQLASEPHPISQDTSQYLQFTCLRVVGAWAFATRSIESTALLRSVLDSMQKPDPYKSHVSGLTAALTLVSRSGDIPDRPGAALDIRKNANEFLSRLGTSDDHALSLIVSGHVDYIHELESATPRQDVLAMSSQKIATGFKFFPKAEAFTTKLERPDDGQMFLSHKDVFDSRVRVYKSLLLVLEESLKPKPDYSAIESMDRDNIRMNIAKDLKSLIIMSRSGFGIELPPRASRN